MPSRCVLPGYANKSDKSKSIGLHKIPFYEDDCPEAIERRKRWVDFIASELADEWNLSKETAVCSAHFTGDSFVRKVLVPGTRPRLICDSIGVVPFPTILTTENQELQTTSRIRPKIIKDLEKEFIQPSTSQAHKRAGNEVKVNKLRKLKSPRKGTQQPLDEASDTEDSGADLCEDFLYEADNFDVEDEVMPESSYAHSQYTEDTDMDSDTEEPNDLTVLAAIHFNSNVQRTIAKKKDGANKIKVVYPKFKNGEATVREKRIARNFTYIQDVYRTLEESLKNPGTLEAAASELKALTPSFMDTTLQKQPRELAVIQWQHRQSLVAVDVPPTTPADSLTANLLRQIGANPGCSVIH
eukprot:gene1982-biopygen1804